MGPKRSPKTMWRVDRIVLAGCTGVPDTRFVYVSQCAGDRCVGGGGMWLDDFEKLLRPATDADLEKHGVSRG